MESVEWTKVKYTHSRPTLRHLLNINLNIKKDRTIKQVQYMCVGGY
jgi:hypothetical protein